jgi:hypothetical protein
MLTIKENHNVALEIARDARPAASGRLRSGEEGILFAAMALEA